ncbi:zinc ribbon domain-containing protein [Streptomyces sp. NPDC001102]
MFLAILAAKAEGAGRHVRAVDPRNTSRQCPDRGHTAQRGGAADPQPTDRTVIAHASSKASSKRSYAGFGRRAASHGRESAVRGG